MGTVVRTDSLAAPQIEPAAAVSDSAEEPAYVEGAGIALGLLLGAALWLIGLALFFWIW